ncbi:uncharacterized protein LOC103705986 [Phoenix dactylifera]|uniref:Uncharacterized protein LOC103705986 n=1 Tax=Phoenix dactylifera TaxID=42345 RepID=A0A8B7BYQ2_PHODC|nr:uncharacterized protein LOC103705986 [Phoenix dactylifera]
MWGPRICSSSFPINTPRVHFEPRLALRSSAGDLRGLLLSPSDSILLEVVLIQIIQSAMGTEDSKDLLKNMDWKTVGGAVPGQPSVSVTKKRLPKKIRQVPDYYFLPRRSLPSAIAVYGALCAAGVGAGMLVEVWINKKIKEDGGVVWEMN